MTCKHALDLVEPIAAGDLAPDESARAHFESCPRCAAALATARRVEAVLASRDAPEAPARFAPSVIQRIRRERWRSEQHVDRLFNVAVVAAFALVGGGILALMNLSGVTATAAGTWTLLASVGGQVARDAAPTLNTYILAACLLMSALGMWWWAERKMML